MLVVLIGLAHASLAAEPIRIYENRLTPIVRPKALLADHPDAEVELGGPATSRTEGRERGVGTGGTKTVGRSSPFRAASCRAAQAGCLCYPAAAAPLLRSSAQITNHSF